MKTSVFAHTLEATEGMLRRALQSPPTPKTPSAAAPLSFAPNPPSTVPANPTAPAKSQLSEKIPDPATFDGTKTDLDRFIDQIQNKMHANADRYTNPHARLTYVTGRLTGAAAAQIRPYNIKGEFVRLRDYQDLLEVLERAYGNPNKAGEARKSLITLKQKNQPFHVFYAEFQRLALEAGMADDNDTLVILLEQALSNELKAQIVTAEPPTGSADLFAAFVQGLENRRSYLMGPNAFTRLPPAVQSRAPAPGTGTAPRTPQQPANAASRTTAPMATYPDPMDLSSQRRYPAIASGGSRRERGECFRCGSQGHLVRDCPQPDTRNLQSRMAVTSPTPSSNGSFEIPIPRGRTEVRSPPFRTPESSVDSGNGTRLS